MMTMMTKVGLLGIRKEKAWMFQGRSNSTGLYRCQLKIEFLGKSKTRQVGPGERKVMKQDDKVKVEDAAEVQIKEGDYETLEPIKFNKQ